MNISWKHGINALSAEEQRLDPRGRISIVLWGLCPPTMVQEEGESVRPRHAVTVIMP